MLKYDLEVSTYLFGKRIHAIKFRKIIISSVMSTMYIIHVYIEILYNIWYLLYAFLAICLCNESQHQ